MARDKKPTLTTSPIDKRVIAEVAGVRMLLNDIGNVVVVMKRTVTPYNVGDVRGMRPEIAHKALLDGEVELHALSVVDHPEDSEDDSAGEDA